jgi:bifunctional DNA-binding transcriptional regulator/antitoxin component of YhaV-PrlF toxin-antitoxin module
LADRTIIRETKVYGGLKTQIPTVMAKDLNIKDGSSVRWIKESGTYVLEPATGKPKFRSLE